ncbi:MAG: flavodoxin domain-containing protein [Campylobacterota bacterium]
MNRRTFLHFGGKLTLASVAAFNFGCSLQPTIGEGKKTALIYGTRYGATRETAEWIAAGTGREVDLLNIETLDFGQSVKEYDAFIVGSGIWIDGPHKRLIELLQTHKETMQEKVIAAFIVCGTTGEDEAGKKRIAGYFDRFYRPLGVKPPRQAYFGGRMSIERLNEKDRKLLNHFYNNVLKKPFVSWDRTDPESAKSFGAGISS